MITAEEGPRTETFSNPVKLMVCYKLNTVPAHHCHTAMNLYEIVIIIVILTVHVHPMLMSINEDIQLWLNT